jgi:hypothetical protein
MLLDEEGTRLFTIASHGFPAEGVGSEVAVGEGVPGTAAARSQPIREGQLRQMHRYSDTVRRSFETEGRIGPGIAVPLPYLPETQSQMAVPAMVRGELVGVLVVDSPLVLAFDDDDEAVLTLIATVIAQTIETARDTSDAPPRVAPPVSTVATRGETKVRFFGEDGSVFLDDEYLIRGVAGRILWSLAQAHQRTGRTEFTTKELRLDKSLELPGFRDNLDTRLVMLKRRLDERAAPIRLDRTGRGRFALQLSTSLRLESH